MIHPGELDGRNPETRLEAVCPYNRSSYETKPFDKEDREREITH